jgi:uracil-DNA glycosylase family 4
LFDRALADAGIDRSAAYVTNAVKHFKFERRGKRRIHQKPNWTELAACRPWLDAEIELLSPAVIVCLGATAAQSLLGKDFRVTRQRGEAIESPPLADWVVATIHPSAILRQRDDESWGAKAKVMQENVEHHMEEEEGDMFKQARSIFDRQELDELGERMAARKEQAGRELNIPVRA